MPPKCKAANAQRPRGVEPVHIRNGGAISALHRPAAPRNTRKHVRELSLALTTRRMSFLSHIFISGGRGGRDEP